VVRNFVKKSILCNVRECATVPLFSGNVNFKERGYWRTIRV